MATPYAFNANELWTLEIAAYGAVMATIVFGWDVYKWWKSGPRIDLSVSSGMKMVGGAVPDPITYISARASNVGDRPTTITNMGMDYFESWWHAYVVRRKANKKLIVNDPSSPQRIPYRLEVGGQWTGLADQTDDIVRMAKGGYCAFRPRRSGNPVMTVTLGAQRRKPVDYLPD